MANDSGTKLLVRSLRTHLVPALEKCDFHSIPLSGIHSKSNEIRSAFPFGQMRRERGDKIDIAEIQFNKWGDAAFRVNLGTVPQSGIAHVLGHVPAKDVWVHYLDEYFELYDSRFFRKWFSIRRWSRQDRSRATTTSWLGALQE